MPIPPIPGVCGSVRLPNSSYIGGVRNTPPAVTDTFVTVGFQNGDLIRWNDQGQIMGPDPGAPSTSPSPELNRYDRLLKEDDI
jgi:hypothetical protein